MEISLVELAPGGESISMTFLTLLETFLSTCIHYFKLSLLENLILSFKVLFSYTNLKMKAMNNILKNNCGNLFFFIQMIDINRTDFNHHPLLHRRRLFWGFQTLETERLVSGARPEQSPFLRLRNFLLSHLPRHHRRRRCQSRRDCRHSKEKKSILTIFVNLRQ